MLTRHERHASELSTVTMMEHGQRIKNLRNVLSKTGKTAAILLDTKGPEIAPSSWKAAMTSPLKAGQTFTFTTDKSVVGNNFQNRRRDL